MGCYVYLLFIKCNFFSHPKSGCVIGLKGLRWTLLKDRYTWYNGDLDELMIPSHILPLNLCCG